MNEHASRHGHRRHYHLSPWHHHWLLGPDIVYLNHGSFGACPRAVLEAQARLRDQLEENPLGFFERALEPLLDASRRELAAFVDADPLDLVFVPNATTGVNAVLRSLKLMPGDEVLTTSHAYNACRNALDYVAERTGARVSMAELPFPLTEIDGGSSDGEQALIDRILAKVTSRTRLAMLDHVTSATGLVFPIECIIQALAAAGVPTLVDGAHAPGMVPLSLRTLGADYYTGNCHKWLCSPKGAGFLWVRRERQPDIRPVVISHGANARRTDRSRFQLEFDWTGTADVSAWLVVGEAIRYMGSLVPGGWPALMEQNRKLALFARELLARTLGIRPPAPARMIGTLVAVPLPPGPAPALQQTLRERYGIEVPVYLFPPEEGQRIIRVSAQLYNDRAHYERLAEALTELGLGSS